MSVLVSPCFIPSTPLSNPGIIIPPPTVNAIGSRPSAREESNSSPSSRVPT